MDKELLNIKSEVIDPSVYEIHVVDLFEGGDIESIVTSLENHCRTIINDASTEDGRKEIGRFVRRINKSSKLLDDLGKNHTSQLKQRPKVVDANRKKMRDRLSALSDEIRKPLTEWEETEEKRKQDILKRIDSFNLPDDWNDLGDLNDKEGLLHSLREVVIDETYDEFKGFAEKTLNDNIKRLEGIIAKEELERIAREKAEKEAAEAAAKAQKERDERIAREAAEKAKREAEAAAEREKHELIKREREAQEAKEKAERDRIAAQERAELEKQQAIDAERERARKEKEAEEARIAAEKAEAERKAQNKRHRATINRRILKEFTAAGLPEGSAQALIERIVKGEIKNISINY